MWGVPWGFIKVICKWKESVKAVKFIGKEINLEAQYQDNYNY